jgi:hypothetical protein
VIRLIVVTALVFAAQANAQDSVAYRELRLRAGAVDNIHAGAISEDWQPRVGKQVEVGTPLPVGEMSMNVARIHYKPVTGKPAYKATFISMTWMLPLVRVSRAQLNGGLRLSDYRMDFDDPTVVSGLRTEEEVMPAAVTRARLAIAKRISLFGDASYGVLMLGHHTRMALLSAGAEYALTTPGWLRDIMR